MALKENKHEGFDEDSELPYTGDGRDKLSAWLFIPLLLVIVLSLLTIPVEYYFAVGINYWYPILVAILAFVFLVYISNPDRVCKECGNKLIKLEEAYYFTDDKFDGFPEHSVYTLGGIGYVDSGQWENGKPVYQKYVDELIACENCKKYKKLYINVKSNADESEVGQLEKMYHDRFGMERKQNKHEGLKEIKFSDGLVCDQCGGALKELEEAYLTNPVDIEMGKESIQGTNLLDGEGYVCTIGNIQYWWSWGDREEKYVDIIKVCQSCGLYERKQTRLRKNASASESRYLHKAIESEHFDKDTHRLIPQQGTSYADFTYDPDKKDEDYPLK